MRLISVLNPALAPHLGEQSGERAAKNCCRFDHLEKKTCFVPSLSDRHRIWSSRPKTKASAPEEWDLRLYVSGTTTRFNIAVRNLKRLCEEHLAGRYRIEMVDITKNPQLGLEDEIQVVPTLVRKRPLPIRKIIGILSDTQQVLDDLDLRRRK